VSTPLTRVQRAQRGYWSASNPAEPAERGPRESATLVGEVGRVRASQVVGGRYRLEEQVGAGGMGVVWRAFDEKLEQAVAVKRAASPADADSKRVRRRMRREAHIAAALNHPHIVAFVDEVVEDHERWLVMEYVPSQSLAQILDQFGPLPAHQVSRIGVQIASALEAVHAAGILHRDIKPGNILVTENGTAKLTDFGISRPIYGDVTVTDSGLIGGTVAFLGPEIAGGEEPTASSDVFALGATLFAAAEGMPPFGTADNTLLVLRRAAAGDILPFRLAGPLIPVLSALLQPKPANRPTAGQAWQMLRELADTATDDEGSGPWQWSVGQAPRRRARRRILAIAGACIAALATVAGLVVFPPDDSTSASPLPVLGDPRTADPCALIDARTLSRFSNGTTTYESAYGNFNRCDVIVTLSGGARVQVKVELDKPSAPQGTMEQRGALRLFRQPQNGDHCIRTVVLADQNHVTITAKMDRGPDPADLCVMADAATDHAVAMLTTGTIPRLPTPANVTSLARMDACTLLDSSALTPVLGAGASSPEAGFGNWECHWNSSTGESSVDLYFDRNIPLTSKHGRLIKLGDRDTYIKPEDNEPECDVRVVHRTDLDANGEPVVELIKLDVRGLQPADQMCGPATELAAAAAAKLPS
jgi:eukaryotic-like serine/threonine-protein kinase